MADGMKYTWKASGLMAAFSALLFLLMPVPDAGAQAFQQCAGLNVNRNIGPTGPGGTPVVDITLNPGDQLTVVVTANAGVQTTLSGPFLNNPSFNGSGNVTFTQGQGSGQFIGSLIAVVTGGTANIVATCVPGNGNNNNDVTGVQAAINEANANTQDLVNNAGAQQIARTIPVQINNNSFVTLENRIIGLRAALVQQLDALQLARRERDRLVGDANAIAQRERAAIIDRDSARRFAVEERERFFDFILVGFSAEFFVLSKDAKGLLEQLEIQSAGKSFDDRLKVLERVMGGNERFSKASDATKVHFVRLINDLNFIQVRRRKQEELSARILQRVKEQRAERDFEFLANQAQGRVTQLEKQIRQADEVLDGLQAEYERRLPFRGSGGDVVRLAPAGVRLNLVDGGAMQRLNFGWSLGGLRQSIIALRQAELAALGVAGDGTSHVETRLPTLLADDRLNAWVEGAYAYTDDQRRGGEAESYQLNMDGGVMYRAFERASLGAKFRYRTSRSKRDDGSQTSSADAYGAALFAQIGLPGGANLTPLFAYERSDTNLVLSGGGATVTSDFDTDVYTLGATLSREFDLGGLGTKHSFYIDPNASLSHVTAIRGSHVRSDGSAVSGARVVQGTLTFGPTFGARIAKPFDGVRAMTPTLGLNGVWNFRDGGDSVTANGTVIEAVRFSGSLSAGLATSFDNGASLSVTTSYSGIGSDVRGYGITLRGSLTF